VNANAGSRWRRIVGTILFDASLAVATLGIVRTVIGIKIDLGPKFPLELAGPWWPFLLAGGLFLAAASIRPARAPNPQPNDPALGGQAGVALGAGAADVSPLDQEQPEPVRRRQPES
jgi:hypothetical protein